MTTMPDYQAMLAVALDTTVACRTEIRRCMERRTRFEKRAGKKVTGS